MTLVRHSKSSLTIAIVREFNTCPALKASVAPKLAKIKRRKGF